MKTALIAIGLVAAGAGSARAGGWETDVQSPRGTATVGAQTAVALDPSAVFYNPAGLAWQEGLGAIGGANMRATDIAVETGGTRASGTGLTGAPVVYVGQRVSAHFALGVGVFSNFAEHLEYPPGWAGRRSGTFFDLTTTTVNVGVALRPIPRVSVGFGLTVMPASMDLRHVLGTPEALLHSATTAVGFGGNLGVMAVAVPQYLIFGATYRSAIDLDFTGLGDLTASTDGLTATSTVPLPHTFTFGVSSRPVEKLTLSFDAKLALWHDLSSLTVDLQDPAAGMGAVPTRDPLPLNLRDGYGFRLGGELRPITGLWLALGVGYDRTPVRRGWLQPVIPDNDRVLVGVGAGYRWRCFEAGVGYSAQVVLARTSTYPDPAMATYSGVRHILTLALGVRLEKVGPQNLPVAFTGNP